MRRREEEKEKQRELRELAGEAFASTQSSEWFETKRREMPESGLTYERWYRTNNEPKFRSVRRYRRDRSCEASTNRLHEATEVRVAFDTDPGTSIYGLS